MHLERDTLVLPLIEGLEGLREEIDVRAHAFAIIVPIALGRHVQEKANEGDGRSGLDIERGVRVQHPLEALHDHPGSGHRS